MNSWPRDRSVCPFPEAETTRLLREDRAVWDLAVAFEGLLVAPLNPSRSLYEDNSH